MPRSACSEDSFDSFLDSVLRPGHARGSLVGPGRGSQNDQPYMYHRGRPGSRSSGMVQDNSIHISHVVNNHFTINSNNTGSSTPSSRRLGQYDSDSDADEGTVLPPRSRRNSVAPSSAAGHTTLGQRLSPQQACELAEWEERMRLGRGAPISQLEREEMIMMLLAGSTTPRALRHMSRLELEDRSHRHGRNNASNLGMPSSTRQRIHDTASRAPSELSRRSSTLQYPSARALPLPSPQSTVTYNSDGLSQTYHGRRALPPPPPLSSAGHQSSSVDRWLDRSHRDGPTAPPRSEAPSHMTVRRPERERGPPPSAYQQCYRGTLVNAPRNDDGRSNVSRRSSSSHRDRPVIEEPRQDYDGRSSVSRRSNTRRAIEPAHSSYADGRRNASRRPSSQRAIEPGRSTYDDSRSSASRPPNDQRYIEPARPDHDQRTTISRRSNHQQLMPHRQQDYDGGSRMSRRSESRSNMETPRRASSHAGARLPLPPSNSRRRSGSVVPSDSISNVGSSRGGRSRYGQ